MPVVDLKPPDDPELHALAENLRSLRREYDLSQRELAERIGATVRQVEHWEREESWPALRHLIQLARLFHRPIETLFFDERAVFEQGWHYVTTYINILAKMTRSRVILVPGDPAQPLPTFRGQPSVSIDMRPVPDLPDPDTQSIAEVRGFISISQSDRPMDAILDAVTESIETPTEPECNHS